LFILSFLRHNSIISGPLAVILGSGDAVGVLVHCLVFELDCIKNG
jgi:hypothetical protein